jgi:hypothetical protein
MILERRYIVSEAAPASLADLDRHDVVSSRDIGDHPIAPACCEMPIDVRIGQTNDARPGQCGQPRLTNLAGEHRFPALVSLLEMLAEDQFHHLTGVGFSADGA